MTTEQKDKIRRRISEATGSDIGVVHPEFFLTAKSGRLRITRFECKMHKIVRLQISLMAGRLAHQLPGAAGN